MDDFASYGYPGLLLASFLASTIVPLSSEVVLTTLLLNDFDPYWCVAIATVGNWLGGLTSYAMGFLGKWRWIEKWFKVSKEKVEARMDRCQRFGVWLALITWLPIVGDLVSIGLGFVRAKLLPVALLSLIGRFARFALYTYLFLLGRDAWPF